jgi:hypothetical protein
MAVADQPYRLAAGSPIISLLKPYFTIACGTKYTAETQAAAYVCSTQYIHIEFSKS